MTMKTRSPATATPRLAPPPATPLVCGRWKCQISRPLPASSAMHSLAAVTYMMPPTTSRLDRYAVADIHAYELQLCEFLDTMHPAILASLALKKQIDDALTAALNTALDEFAAVFQGAFRPAAAA